MFKGQFSCKIWKDRLFWLSKKKQKQLSKKLVLDAFEG